MRLSIRFSQPLLLAALMLFVLAAGTLYSLHLGNSLTFGDEYGYDNVARHLANQHWYSETGQTTSAFRAPGYPFLLCLLMWLHVSIAGFRIVNFLALIGAMGLAYLILRQNGSAGAGLLAAGLLAVYPVLFYTAGTLYPQEVGVFLTLLTVWLGIREGVAWRNYVLAGLVFGYLMLLIPSMLPMLIIFALMPKLLRRPQPGRLALILVALSLLTVAPWTVRNYAVFHRFIPISTNGGLNLLLGNSEHAGPDTGYLTDISVYQRQAQGMNEPDQDTFYRNAALTWIAHHPVQAARLYVLKVLTDFSAYNKINTQGVNSTATTVLMVISYGPLLAIFIVRWLLARVYPPTPLECFIACAYLANALLTAIFFTRIRFRLPFDALLICAVAAFLEAIWRTRAIPASGRRGGFGEIFRFIHGNLG